MIMMDILPWFTTGLGLRKGQYAGLIPTFLHNELSFILDINARSTTVSVSSSQYIWIESLLNLTYTCTQCIPSCVSVLLDHNILDLILQIVKKSSALDSVQSLAFARERDISMDFTIQEISMRPNMRLCVDSALLDILEATIDTKYNAREVFRELQVFHFHEISHLRECTISYLVFCIRNKSRA